jgi:homoserine kinase
MPVTEFKPFTVTVPATTANIGPGFDCLGAALCLHNQFTFALTAEETRIRVTGLESNLVQTDRQNLAYQAFAHFYQHIGQTPPPVDLQIQLGVPLARGLGSSATAIVGGLVGANTLAGRPLSQQQVLDLAIALEGHPDNVAPALMGGCCLAATGTTPQSWVLSEIPWSAVVTPIVAIPDFELPTRAAREVLPQTCSYADAIFNTAHLGLLLRGLETGRPDWLEAALQDRLHQPYRERLIPGYGAVQNAALTAGAYGLVISGAGPTLLALSSPAKADQVATAMQTAWKTAGITAEAKPLLLDYEGAITRTVESPA